MTRPRRVQMTSTAVEQVGFECAQESVPLEALVGDGLQDLV